MNTPTDAELKEWWDRYPPNPAAPAYDETATRIRRLIAALIWMEVGAKPYKIDSTGLGWVARICNRIGIPFDEVAAVLGVKS